MNILVTGGAGFIGSHLCSRLLKEGYNVKCFDNFYNGNLNNIRGLFNHESFQFIKGDVRDMTLLRESCRDVDHVFHLAAQIHVERSLISVDETFDINIRGTRNVLELCKENKKIGMTFASSAEVYGGGFHGESSPLNPQSPYAASKVASEAMCVAYHHAYGTNVRILRNFNTFGPRQKSHGYGAVIAIFTQRVMNDKSPIIYGDGSQTRDYQYIDDAIECYVLSLDMPSGEVCNTGSGEEYTINDIATRIIHEFSETSVEPIHVDPRPGEVMALRADIKKLNGYGYYPRVGFDEGLKKFVKWSREYSFESLGYMT